MKKLFQNLSVKVIALFVILALSISLVTSICLYLRGNDTPTDNPEADDEGSNSISNIIGGKFTDREIKSAEDAILAVQDVKEELALTNAVEELTVATTNTVDNITYYRLQQNYKGIPVYGSQVIVISDENGEAQGLTGNAMDVDTEISLTPTVTYDQVVSSIQAYVGAEAVISVPELSDDMLMVYNYDDVDEPVLVYSVDAFVDAFPYQVLINATDSTVVKYIAMYDAINYTGSDKPNISVYDFDGAKWDVSSFNDNTKLDWVVDDNLGYVLKLANKTLGFYDELFGIKGYNNKNGCVYISFDCIVDGKSSGEYDAYSIPGEKLEYTFLVFCAKNSANIKIDALAHEYMHSVEKTISDMESSGMTQSIKEAYSDIFGELVEDWANDGMLDNDCDWKNHFRNYRDPLSQKKPIEYKGNYWGKGKSAEAINYNNSTVISHAAYLMTQVGNGGDPLTMEELAKLWYHTLQALPQNCTFNILRRNMLMTANHLNYSHEKINCITSVFDQAGISDSIASENDYEIYGIKPRVIVYDINGCVYKNFSVKATNIKDNTETYGTWDEKENAMLLSLIEGLYKIEITDLNYTRETYVKYIKLSSSSSDDKIIINTDFSYIKPDYIDFISNGDGTCSIQKAWGFDEDILNIPKYSPSGDLVTSIGSFINCTSLVTVNIPDSVTKIEPSAFSKCTSLQHVILSNDSKLEEIGDGTFSDCSALPTIELPNTVKKIGDQAFYGCSSLAEIKIPTSVETIGSMAFYQCTNLWIVQISDESDTYDSNVSIGNSAFGGCNNLESLTIYPNIMRIDEYAFAWLEKLENIWFMGTEAEWNAISKASSWASGKEYIIHFEADDDTGNNDNTDDTSTELRFELNYDGESYSVVGIGSCHATELIIPGTYNGLPVTQIANSAFSEFHGSFTSVVIPNSVTVIGDSAFEGCTLLESVEIPDSVTSIGSCAFMDCTALKKIVIPNSVTYMGSKAFFNCTSAKNLYISEGLTSISWAAFGFCQSLVSVHLPESIESIEMSGFTYCTSLRTVFIPEKLASIGSMAFDGSTSLFDVYYAGSSSGWNNIAIESYNTPLLNANIHFGKEDIVYSEGLQYVSNGDGTCYVNGIGTCTDTDIVIPSVYNGQPVTSIGYYAFYECTNLTSITIPNSITNIREAAFMNCSSLTSITIPDSVINISDNAFCRCSSLTEISVSANNAYYCSENGVLFNKEKTELICYPADKTEASYSIPSGVTSIAPYAFYWCSSLTSVTIPASMMDIGPFAFIGCNSLTDISVPASNEYYYSENGVLFNKEKTELLRYPAGKTETVYSIPDSVTSIGRDAFYGCGNLTSIVIPDSVTSIGSGAFENCDSLTSITIPNGVTSIGLYTFFLCDSLTSVTIPDSVTSIDKFAFSFCNRLTSIQFTGTTAQWQAIAFGSSWNSNTGNYTVYCLDGQTK